VEILEGRGYDRKGAPDNWRTPTGWQHFSRTRQWVTGKGLQAKGYRQILRRRSKTIVISSKTTTAVRDLTQVKIADPVYFERICGGSLQNAADEVDEGSLEWMCGLEKQ
jgi:hypothetical protein